MRSVRPTWRLGALALAGVLALGLSLVPAPTLPAAHAAAGVTLDAGGRGAVIDATYSTRLRVSGSGFQSIKGGHGGVYVWFGTVTGRWQPSKGGRSGVNYFYVPDTEDRTNQGFQQFVAFPGSDTASSSGAQLSPDGSFTVTLVVPGPTFQAVGRNGAVRTVDCRKQTCGVITVGAHGVRNANNETFTPVRVADLQVPAADGSSAGDPATGQDAPGGQDATSPQGGDASAGGAAVAPSATGTPTSARPRPPAGPVRLRVDRASAVAGRALAWSAARLTPGRQFSVVLDDGEVASGPHSAGPDGRASGVISLPPTIGAGTHELRLYGAGRAGTVRFGVVAGDDDLEPTAAAAPEDPAPEQWLGWGFALLAALALGTALAVRRRPGRARA